MMLRSSHIVFGLILLTLLTAFGFIYKSVTQYHKEIPLTNERELKVTLDAGVGDVSISRIKDRTDRLFEADINAELKDDLSKYVDYSSRDRIGYLNINTVDELDKERRNDENHRDHSFHWGGLESNRWDLRFREGTPIAFDMQLGFGKGDLDLTGLTIKDLNLSTGASSVDLRFDEPNRTVIEDMTIESGLSKFRAEGLNNANFNHLKFEGGVGSYSLDFGGKLTHEVDADIEVGLGALTVIIPEDIGVKITYEKSLIAHLDLDRNISEQGENTYLSSNYSSARGRMNLHIEAGVGSVKIRRE